VGEHKEELESPDGARVVAIGGEMLTGSEIYARCLEEVKIRKALEARVAELEGELADSDVRTAALLTAIHEAIDFLTKGRVGHASNAWDVLDAALHMKTTPAAPAGDNREED